MILLRDIIGHDEIIKTLQGAIASGRVAHAHLFSGPEGVGKMTVAIAFARALICPHNSGYDSCGKCGDCEKVEEGTHPRVRIIQPEGASIKIRQVREMIAGLQFGPDKGDWVIRIINEADTMTPEAGNSMLKILEEPLPGVVFILITTRPQVVLPTILSRCQHRYFQPLTQRQLVDALSVNSSYPAGAVRRAAALSGGRLGRARELLSGSFTAREEALSLIERLNRASAGEVFSLAAGISSGTGKETLLSILDMMILWFRDILLYNETSNTDLLINSDKSDKIKALSAFYPSGRLIGMLDSLENVKKSLALSANTQLAIEALFLNLAGFGPDIDGKGVL